jgi:peptidylprolyl isomerase
LNAGTRNGHPSKDDLIAIAYSGWTTDGKMVMNTPAGGPLTVNVNMLLPGLREGIFQMETGETRMMWIPEALAYKGQTGKPKGMLVFVVTLVDMPMRAPADVKAPPPGAQYTASHLAYLVLKEGTGTRHPKKIDEVTVNYTGWTTNGTMFDSSFKQGQPLSLYLDRAIPGWTEGLQLMVEGEKARLWIPENLAYKGRNPPYGMLVFDIELLSIR